MRYEDIFEMLEAVRTHPLSRGEPIVSTSSVTGDVVGFATADTQGPSTKWDILVSDLRHSCLSRTSEEAQVVLRRMRAYLDRKFLIDDLRSGALVLEERPGEVGGTLKKGFSENGTPVSSSLSAEEEPSDFGDFFSSLQG